MIPKEYAQKYGITNLWKFNIPNGRRLAYSVKGGDEIVLCIILEWFSHKDYEKRFGYKTK